MGGQFLLPWVPQPWECPSVDDQHHRRLCLGFPTKERDGLRPLCNPHGSSHIVAGAQLIDWNQHLITWTKKMHLKALQRGCSISHNITRCLLYTRPWEYEDKKTQSMPSRSSETSKAVSQVNGSLKQDVVKACNTNNTISKDR